MSTTEPTTEEVQERPIVCPACGAVAVHKDDMLVTEHELDCAWLQNPNSERYDDDDSIHTNDLSLVDPAAGVDDRGEGGAGEPQIAPTLAPPEAFAPKVEPSLGAIKEHMPPIVEDLIPQRGSLRETRDIAEVEGDAIDGHIRMAAELLEGSASNMAPQQIQLSLAHSAVAQAMMTRWMLVNQQ